MKFPQYCQPCKNVPIERYRFNSPTQEPGETYHQYDTALRKLAEGYEYQSVTPGEILCERFVFGIKEGNAKKRLLRESNLTLLKTDEICRATESVMAQMKMLGGNSETVSVVKSDQEHHKSYTDKAQSVSDRINICDVGTVVVNMNTTRKTYACPAHGEICSKCSKPNYFASKCRNARTMTTQRSVRAVEEDTDEGK